jgi:hypothetical protein
MFSPLKVALQGMSLSWWMFTVSMSFGKIHTDVGWLDEKFPVESKKMGSLCSPLVSPLQ